MAHSKIIYTPLQSRALVLDGSHYLSLADPAQINLGSDDFGLELQGRIDADTPIDNLVLIQKVNGDWDNQGAWALTANKTSRSFILGLNDGSPTAIGINTPNNVFTFGQEFYLGVSAHRAGQARFYLNGLDIGGGDIFSRPGSLDNTGNFQIGQPYMWQKGALGLVRIDQGRVLPDAWYAQEWDRLRYGCRREPHDFLACWLFGDTLVDSSPNAFPLVWQGGGSPAFADGWPYSAGPLSYTFEKDCETEYEFGYLDRDDKQVAADGSDFTDAAPLKRTFKLSFKALSPAQQTAFTAIWQTRQSFQFFLDGDQPADGWYKLSEPPKFKNWVGTQADVDLTLEES